MGEKFDTIVVGGGPAGCAAAYRLAKEGLSVLVIERGEYPGAKNVFGGVLHTAVLNELFPSFWEEAPVERYITKRAVFMLGEESSLNIEFRCKDYGRVPYNGFTTLRARFDRWLAKKAEEVGALILTDTKVDDLLWDENKVIGVKVGKKEGEVFADVVIAADGANSLIAEKANLRKPISPKQMALGIKEVWAMRKDLIERRFGLAGNEGAAYLFVGQVTEGLEGGGFIYTNKESLSIGVTCHLSGLIREGKKASEVIETFKEQDVVKSLIEQGEMREYCAHLIPEGGIQMVPQLYSDGILVAGDAAGFTLNSGFNVRGGDFAIGSGVIAAEAVLIAKGKSDYSKKSLSVYQKLLEGSFILKDLKIHRGLVRLLGRKSTYDIYPQLILSLFKSIYNVENKPKKRFARLLLDEIRTKGNLFAFARDFVEGIRWL